MSMRAVCSMCASQAHYAVVLPGLPGVKPAGACDQHLATVTTRMAGGGRAASVTVYLLEKGMPPAAAPGADKVAEQVRRIGAHSRDRALAHHMEDQLHLAVLAMIAQGAERPDELAAAALQTHRYGFERVAG
jgi:hypothetical protein